MEKRSNVGIPCTYCDKDAILNTDPPVCEDHLTVRKEASADSSPDTLKELAATDE